MCILPLLSFGQRFNWMNQYGTSTGNESVTAMTLGQNRELAIGVDTAFTSVSNDVLLRFIDSNGVATRSSVLFRSNGAKDKITDIAYSTGVGYFVTGKLDDTTRIGASSTAYSFAKGGGYFVSKFFTNGNLDWITPNGNLGQLGRGEGKSITTDGSGNVYVLGEFIDSLILRTVPKVIYKDSGLGDVFLVKYNSSGVYQWSQRIYGTKKVEATAVEYDVNRNELVVCGNYTDVIYFNSTSFSLAPTTVGKKDVFVARFNSGTGSRISSNRIIASTNDVEAFDMILNGSNPIFSGGFLGSFSAGGGSAISSNGAQDMFIVQARANNTIIATNNYGGNGSESVKKLALVNSNLILGYGNFNASINFSGKTINPNSSVQDAFLLSLDTSGTLLGAHGALANGGSDIVNTNSLVVDANKTYIGGGFKWFAKFGNLGTRSSAFPGYFDGFVSQIKSSSIYCEFNDTLDLSTNFRTIAGPRYNLCFSDSGVIKSRATSPYTFQWYRNGTAIAGATLDSIHVSDSGNYSLQLTLASRSCSEYTDTLKVNIDSLPVTEVVPDTFCIGPGFVQIGLTPTFSFTQSSISSTAGGVVGFPPQYQPSSAGVGLDTIIYSYTDPISSCVGIDTGIFIVNGLPNILANNSKNYCKNGLTDTLRFDTTHHFASWKYSMTPSIIANDSILNPNLLSASNHSIKYEVTDSNGCLRDTNVTITIYPIPNIGFMLSPNRLCSNNPLLTISGAFPAGGVFSGRGVTDSLTGKYLAANVTFGLDTITYTVTNAAGCVIDSSQIMLIDTVPVVSQILPTKICESDSVIKLAGGLPFVIDIAEASGYIGSPFIGSNDEFFPDRAGAGKHEVNYWFRNKLGCADTTRTDSIIVNGLPLVSIIPKTNESGFGGHCENGGDFVLTQGKPLGGTYTFQNKVLVNDRFYPDGSGVNIGVDSIFYSFTDTNGCAKRVGDEILVKAQPRIVFPTLPFSPVCNNAAPIDLVAMGDTLISPPPSNGGWFTFDTINKITTLEPSSFVVPGALDPLTKEIWYIYLDTNTSCGDTSSQLFTINPSPEVNISGRTSACQGIASTLSGEGGILFNWSTGDSSKEISFVQDTATTYTVTVTSIWGCTDSASQLVEMTQGNYFKAKSDSTTLKKGGEVYLDVLERNFPADTIAIIGEFRILNEPKEYDVFNQDPGVNSRILSNFYYKPKEDFRRIDSLQYKMCDSTCINICDSAWVKFRVLGDPYEFLPNGFSPNGDGINDFWVVPGIEAYPQNELFIYNRWGDLIYQAAPYDNTWDGKPSTGLRIGGSSVVDGTYFFVLNMGDSEPLKGSIELKSR